MPPQMGKDEKVEDGEIAALFHARMLRSLTPPNQPPGLPTSIRFRYTRTATFPVCR
jgi:hypothetical protein